MNRIVTSSQERNDVQSDSIREQYDVPAAVSLGDAVTLTKGRLTDAKDGDTSVDGYKASK